MKVFWGVEPAVFRSQAHLLWPLHHHSPVQWLMPLFLHIKWFLSKTLVWKVTGDFHSFKALSLIFPSLSVFCWNWITGWTHQHTSQDDVRVYIKGEPNGGGERFNKTMRGISRSRSSRVNIGDGAEGRESTQANCTSLCICHQSNVRMITSRPTLSFCSGTFNRWKFRFQRRSVVFSCVSVC